MKTAVVLVVLGMLLLNAEALKCRKSACSGSRPCSSTTVTCERDSTLCFVMLRSKPIVSLTRGCITEGNCAILKSFDPNVRCCSTDLCN
ncbi:secreted LY6/PLAUR domain containing 1-like S homeolog precursor [Xenopus laevis]|uniref:Ly-6/uPAR-related protein-1 n=3 Tax=Xenopus laevis TaxID=8355 RepID=Q90ZP3_XENLA|nr:secreted LY6/PLAUR domain containing 1-like S homeolog precursor [Xenopus laevis]AAK52825.1 Ly-6/uPAR-related protein-1 [Xenopus laevis]OCT83281.1 hypothetical protein XELAEV_18025818mg [Xenopus laevis]